MIKTTSGFTCEVNKAALKNMELIDALADFQGNDVLAVSRILRLILSPDDKQRLYDHLRQEDGTVPADLVAKEIVDIFQSLGDAGKK